MANSVVEIAGVKVAPGQRQTVDIPAALMYTHNPMTLPVHVVNGRRDGPSLVVCAAIHGDEINGVEIIRRLLQMPALRRLSGVLLAVPIVNVFGFTDRSRYLPDRRDLNRSFPGSERGSLAGRIANLFKTEVLDHASHIIDLHTAAIHRDNLPQIRANLDDPVVEAMARAFGTPVMINTPLIEGSLRHTMDKAGVPAITYEAGEALRFQEGAIKAGVSGIIRVMRHLEMIPRSRSRKPAKESNYAANSSSWTRAEQDGIFRAVVPLGAHVRKGQLLGYVSDPFGEREITVDAPFGGIVIGRNNLPLVHEGEALFHIARFDAAGKVARDVEEFNRNLYEEEGWQGEPPIV
ncbi:succinylglutamate desuccinylase/aspartoacylase family protein [Ectothiorhodospiraceae bacterium WFHF3C12]|nr:succinylglutamate desuccinylase/aspartoacylase family protein [Ectothiorhodospiraceae bacterium WFHF3C12]